MANILMIEDDVEFAEVLKDILKNYNFKVTIYDDPFLGLSAGISNFDLGWQYNYQAKGNDFSNNTFSSKYVMKF